MAQLMDRMRCAACNKQNAITKCEGCAKSFCFNDFGNHRQELNKKLDEIETNRNLIRQSLVERIKEPKKHPLLQEIDQWELESINKIKQVAEENRESIFRFTKSHNNQLETKLNELTNQLKQSHEENDFIEAHLDHWNKELTQIQEELIKPSNIKINYNSTPFITKIHTEIPSLCSTVASLRIPNINIDAKWTQNGITVAGGNGSGGGGLNQLSMPWSVHVDDDQTVYVADYANHRIVEWKSGTTSGRIVAGGNGPGNRNDQLHCPTNVIVDSNNDCLIICDYGNKRVVRWPRQNSASGETIISNVGCWDLTTDDDGYVYVCDFDKSEVRRWKIGETNGTIVAGGNGQGNRLDQLTYPSCICVDNDLSVYVSDYGNHRVMKWMKGAGEGIILAGGQGSGLTPVSHPGGIVVDSFGSVYVADYGNHRVMKWMKGATQGSIVVSGSYSWDLSFDRQNNLYVVEYKNHRIQKYNIEQNSH